MIVWKAGEPGTEADKNFAMLDWHGQHLERLGTARTLLSVTLYAALAPPTPAMYFASPHAVQQYCFGKENAPAIPEVIGGHSARQYCCWFLICDV